MNTPRNAAGSAVKIRHFHLFAGLGGGARQRQGQASIIELAVPVFDAAFETFWACGGQQVQGGNVLGHSAFGD